MYSWKVGITEKCGSKEARIIGNPGKSSASSYPHTCFFFFFQKHASSPSSFFFPKAQMNGMRNVIPAIWIQSTGVSLTSPSSALTSLHTVSMPQAGSLSFTKVLPSIPPSMIIASLCQNFCNCPEKISSQFILYVKAR